MRYFVIFLTAVILPFTLIMLIAPSSRYMQSREDGRTATGKDVARNTNPAPIGADAVETIKDSWAKDQKLLGSYEQEQSKLRMEVIKRRRLYEDGQISKAAVLEAERSLVSVLTQIHEVRRSMMERDMAITEATTEDELLRMPVPDVNGFSETEHLARFNGGARWSLKEAASIENFYSKTFGRNLPVTAYGQTTTHKRMRLDHRGSMDVALHPDSAEKRLPTICVARAYRLSCSEVAQPEHLRAPIFISVIHRSEPARIRGEALVGNRH